MTDTPHFHRIHVYTDGSSHGNPGPGGYAYLICDDSNTPISSDHLGFPNPSGDFIGDTTNNIAEYTAVIHALDAIASLSFDSVIFFSDSELMVKQVNGIYKVKNENLRPLYQQVIQKMAGISEIHFENVRRSHPNIHICDRHANALVDDHSKSKPKNSVMPNTPTATAEPTITCPNCHHSFTPTDAADPSDADLNDLPLFS